jgi:hypothetical protein
MGLDETLSKKKPLFDVIGSALTPTLTIIAILVYVLPAVGYSQFYNTLGVDPSAVGLGYTDVLISLVLALWGLVLQP